MKDSINTTFTELPWLYSTYLGLFNSANHSFAPSHLSSINLNPVEAIRTTTMSAARFLLSLYFISSDWPESWEGSCPTLQYRLRSGTATCRGPLVQLNLAYHRGRSCIKLAGGARGSMGAPSLIAREIVSSPGNQRWSSHGTSPHLLGICQEISKQQTLNLKFLLTINPLKS